MQGLVNYGKRIDGTSKGTGWFGELPMLDGKHSVMTEQAMTFDYGKGNVLVPLINPYSTRDELFRLSLGKEPTKEMINKAERWGFERISRGQSPFITAQEQPLKEPVDNPEHGMITGPLPWSLKGTVKGYWYNTSPEEKFMDAVTNVLSLAAGSGLALKGLAAAKHASKPVANVGRKFVTDLAKGLAREGVENVVADKINSEILDRTLMAEDAYRVAKLLNKL